MEALETFLGRVGELPLFANARPVTVTSRGSVGETPLHIAAIWGDVEAIRLLVQAGADINAAGEHGHTPLQEAVGQHKLEATKALVELGADTKIKNEWGETAEQIATVLCLWDQVEVLRAAQK